MAPEPDGGKLVAHSLSEAEVATTSAPLAALYLLAPVRARDDAGSAHRQLLPAVEATMGVLQHAKIALLLGKSEGGVLLQRAAALSNATPVFRLSITRELSRLPATAQQVMAWHRTSGALVESPRVERR